MKPAEFPRWLQLFGLAHELRQRHGTEDANNHNHDQELNQGEALLKTTWLFAETGGQVLCELCLQGRHGLSK